jgi:cytochrome b561
MLLPQEERRIMPLKNTDTDYGLLAQAIHWATVLLFAYMLYLGFTMIDMERTPERFDRYGLHKSIGITIFALSILRLLWRWVNHSPSMPDGMAGYERFLAKLTHVGLYVLIIGLPLSGWVMSSAAGYGVTVFDLFTLPHIADKSKELVDLTKEIHEWLVWIAIGVISLHALAALKHHFINKDDVLKRMLLPAKKK